MCPAAIFTRVELTGSDIDKVAMYFLIKTSNRLPSFSCAEQLFHAMEGPHFMPDDFLSFLTEGGEPDLFPLENGKRVRDYLDMIALNG